MRGKVDYNVRLNLVQERYCSENGLTITAFLLSIPLIVMLYSILCFSVALVSYCLRNSGIISRIFFLIILGVFILVGLVTFIFFWRIWGVPGEVIRTPEGPSMFRIPGVVRNVTKEALGWVRTFRESQKPRGDVDLEKGTNPSEGA